MLLVMKQVVSVKEIINEKNEIEIKDSKYQKEQTSAHAVALQFF